MQRLKKLGIIHSLTWNANIKARYHRPVNFEMHKLLNADKSEESGQHNKLELRSIFDKNSLVRQLQLVM